MRPTVNAIPASTSLRSRWQLPVGVIVHPMADESKGREVPVIPLGVQGIVRCRRCRTYMNPFMPWTDGGRRFKCNVCALANEVPVEYFSTLDADGRRRDHEERPELSRGTVEWVAPAEYMVRPPMPPVYFFVIDVSAEAVSSGFVGAAAAAIKSCLDQLPGDERTMVGLLAFDSALHFYHLGSRLESPQMLVVGELDEPFLPLPDELLVNLRESKHLLEAALDSLPASFPPAASLPSATGPALQAAFLAMGAMGGKMLLFQQAVPSAGIGKVKQRDNPSLYGTEREASLRVPEDPFFKRFAAECSRAQITLDVFAANAQYMDLASLAAIPRYTCGQMYYYPGFLAARDGARLAAEVVHNLTRPTAWEAVMRIRCSKGLRISSFHGHFFNRSTDLLALPTCDPDKAFAVEISHEETMVAGPLAFVQCALLYTSSNGERRIRVHTMALPVVQELSDLYASADCGALVCMMAKLGVEKAQLTKLQDTRNSIEQRVSQALKEYRLLHAAASRAPGALVFPGSLRYLPVFTLGLLKSTAFRGTGKDVAADDRAVAAHQLMAASVDDTLRTAYPQVYAVGDPSGSWGTRQQANGAHDTHDAPLMLGGVVMPPVWPASTAYLRPDGVYLIDNGRILVLYVGREVAPSWLAQVLGPDAQQPGVDVSQFPVEPARQDSQLSQRLCTVVDALRSASTSGWHAPCFAVRQGSPLEVIVSPLLVEDRGPQQPSYSDFMQILARGATSKA